MNATWQSIIQVVRVGLLHPVQVILAQAAPLPVLKPAPPEAVVEEGLDYAQALVTQLIDFIPKLLAAVLILLVGLVIAAIAATVTREILNRTEMDNRIAAGLTGGSDSKDLPKVEKLISGLVFGIVVLFTVVAVLQTLQLQTVSVPLNNFLIEVIVFLPRLVGALILLAVAWFLATVVKLVTIRGLAALNLDERLHHREDTFTEANQLSISKTIANAAYWFIFLFFLLLILDTLELNEALRPVRILLEQIVLVVPNILSALVIAAVGWLVATVVRRIVADLLLTTGIDQLGTRLGLSKTQGGQSLSGIVGTTIYVLILIPVAIAALNALQIEAISVPAIAMLNEILNALPEIFAAGLILILAYFLGRFVSDLLTSILTTLGFNNIFSLLGLPSPKPTITVVSPTEQPTVIQPEPTPSEIAGIIAFVGIMLFATVAAVNILNIPALTALVTGIIVIFGRILAGLVVFAIGLYLANLAYRIIASSGDRQAQILAQAARIATITLVSAMALQLIGIASDIVNLAFGLLLGAIATAIALAFGLGSRDIAAEQVREWLDSFKGGRNQPPKI